MTRQDYVVRFYDLTRDQHGFLSALIEHETIASAMHGIARATGKDSSELTLSARRWLQDWAEAGFFRGYINKGDKFTCCHKQHVNLSPSHSRIENYCFTNVLTLICGNITSASSSYLCLFVSLSFSLGSAPALGKKSTCVF